MSIIDLRMPPNFTRAEFERSQIAQRFGIDNTVPSGLIDNMVRIAWGLQQLRDKLSWVYGRDVPVHITSGYRSPLVNRKVGGSRTSYHMRALAADIRVDNWTSHDLAKFIEEHLMNDSVPEAFRFDTVINEFGRWVHVNVADEGYEPRLRTLTAKKDDKGRTVYIAGIHDEYEIG